MHCQRPRHLSRLFAFRDLLDFTQIYLDEATSALEKLKCFQHANERILSATASVLHV